MVITCTPIRQVFWNWQTEFRVLACQPSGDLPEGFALNKYGNFTLSGTNITDLTLFEETTVTLKADPSSKYEASYNLVGVAGMAVDGDKIKIEPSQEYGILSRFMTAGQARNVNEAYPNFIQLVMDGKTDEIDYKKIKNVGKTYLNKYISKLSEERDKLMLLPVASEYGIEGLEDIAKIMVLYSNAADLRKGFETNPYKIICKHLEYPFERADKLILAHKPQWINTVERCEYACISILKQNEEEGDTRINANVLARFVKNLAPETMDKIVDAVTHGEQIYYDPVTKYAALEVTYMAEALVAQEIRKRVDNPLPTPMEWEQFKTVDGFNMTEEQAKILELVGNGSRVNLLTGGAGCVDCDTEFFDGKGWKRIADYQDGDSVLQYNQDGTATLVNPERYIKVPCDSLWHFETKYGVNQTVCDEHRIIYWSKRGKQNECSIKDIMKAQSLKGWANTFKTAFAYSGGGMGLTDAELRVMCAVICDGSFDGRSSSVERENKYCLVSLKKQRKKDRLRQLLTQANIEWKEHKCVSASKLGYTNFMFYAPVRTKIFSNDWYSCSQRQLKIIAEEVIHWDGHIRTTPHGAVNNTFCSSVKENIDFIQFAYASNGIRATIREVNTTKTFQHNGKEYSYQTPIYYLTVCHNVFVGLSYGEITATKIERVLTTDGFKYCFTVPSGMLVLRRKDCIFITGNCGKTASIKALIRMLESNGHTYTLLAPTGIAAKRMRESTGRSASTIHKFLVHENAEGGEYVIIDETSMVGVHLLANLLRKIGETPNIIFVCDPAQLASISCGNIVQDIIDTGIVPTATLTKVFRYGIGGIATISTDTRSGTPFKPPYDFPDYTYTPCGENPVGQALNAYEGLLRKGYDKTNIMVLCPYNKSKVGTYALNAAIQNRYNLHPDSQMSYERDHHQIMFKVGDKVVNIVNDYHMPAVEIDENGQYACTNEFMRPFTIPVMNGDIGYVREIFEGETPSMIVEFDNKFGIIDAKNIKNLLLGYALSIHRVQGAQAKAVILLVDKSHKSMLSRNLLYVGLSRAQKELVEIADADVINAALEVEENKMRDTWLKDLLKENNHAS